MTDSLLNQFVSVGTAAARAAYTPSPPTPGTGPSQGYFWHESDTGDTYSWKAGTGWVQVNGAGTGPSTSLSQISSSLSGAISSTSSLSTAVSTGLSSTNSTNVTQSTSLSIISSSLSGAISSRASGDTSLSTVISGSISTVTSSINSLSTAVGGDMGVLHVQEQQASTTDGGTFTSGAWRTRVLNTTVLNTITSASLASNQISLPAGTYDIFARAPGFRVTHHQAKLVNITDTADILLGSTEFVATATTNGASNSVVQGRFTLAGTKTIELQHRCFTTLASTGLGSGSGNNWGTVVFSDVYIRRVS